MKRRMFKPGRPIRSIGEFIRCHEKREWVWLFNRPKHPSIIVNMSVLTVLGFIRNGALKKAIKQ